MKKKIALAFSLIILIFLAAGSYIISTMQTATVDLDRLITLHQVEILREHLLLQIHEVQTDLILQETSYSRQAGDMAQNVRNLEQISSTCADCHHSSAVTERIDRLLGDVAHFKTALEVSRGRSGERTKAQNAAFLLAEDLKDRVDQMIHIATSKLAEQTRQSMEAIGRSKQILYILLMVTPLLTALLGFYFIRTLTRPVDTLLEATRRLSQGDLDYRIQGLADEFGEVATSFNQMSDALVLQMRRLQESEKHYRLLFESAGDAIFILEAEGDQRGKILSANRAAAEMHGYTLEEIQQLSIQDLDTPEEARKAGERFQQILNGKWIKEEIEHRRKDGQRFPVEISAGLMEIEGHKFVLAFDRDITERKQMEDLLRISKQDWEDTFNAITDLITIHDSDFNIIRANKAAREDLGLPETECLQAKCYRYYHGQDHPPESCRSCSVIDTLEPTAFEVYEPHLQRLFEVRAMPRFDRRNELVGVIHVQRDITERKRIEEALQRAEQMKLVGEWATSLAHEIKNPLAGIKVSVEVLADELQTEEDKAVVNRAVEEIRRIEFLLKSLLNFAKPPKPQMTLTHLNEVLNKTAAFALRHPSLSQNLAGKVLIETRFDARVPAIMADTMQLQQIFLNLLLNSIEAMPEGGALTLETRLNSGGRRVQVSVTDTGAGIPEEFQEKIFHPFFTTKKKGSGLGLAITKRLIEQHRGSIAVESTAGRGAVFHLSFPVRTTPEETPA